jgi:hypothetical protein
MKQLLLAPAGQQQTCMMRTDSGMHDLLLQVVPSQGFPVLPGGSYTLRISVADANNGLVDSVLMLPVGGLKLLATPSISAGGPYAVVSRLL